MNKTSFRILDTLSRDLNGHISIRKLTDMIKELHGTAYYKNIYDKIQELKKQDILNILKVGKSSVISLNFSNYSLADILSEIELKKKKEFLEKKPEAQLIFLEIEELLKNFNSIKSAMTINPRKNLKLNRLEFIILLANNSKEEIEIPAITSVMEKIQNKYNIKIDSLILTEKRFLKFMNSNDDNPLKEMFWDKIVFFHPQSFWIIIRTGLKNGMKIISERIGTNPAKITEKDLMYNLSRFGYKEMGIKIEKGNDICVEYIITSILLQSGARRIYAIPVILAKNKINYNLLTFLCQKYKKMGQLLGIIKILNKIKKDREIKTVIRILESVGTKKIKFNQDIIEKNLRLYNAT